MGSQHGSVAMAGTADEVAVPTAAIVEIVLAVIDNLAVVDRRTAAVVAQR